MLFLKQKLLNDCKYVQEMTVKLPWSAGMGRLEREWSEAWMSPGPGLGMLPWNPSALMEHNLFHNIFHQCFLYRA